MRISRKEMQELKRLKSRLLNDDNLTKKETLKTINKTLKSINKRHDKIKNIICFILLEIFAITCLFYAFNGYSFIIK